MNRRKWFVVLLVSLVTAGSAAPASVQVFGNLFGPRKAPTLDEERSKFKTELTRKESANEPVPQPPADLFRIVKYESPVGKMAAYLTLDPKDGKKHPAIVWITGGDCNSIGDVWSEARVENDQTAAVYRKAGIVMLFPSLRGGNQNPGFKEGFLGEVDDVLAAADFLAKQEFVDPQRIYLGGHSTGGTLAMLAAQSSKRFRAVFSFGPAHSVRGYPPAFLPFDASPAVVESHYRDPINWLHSIQSPLFVFEGSRETIGAMSLDAMSSLCKNPLGHFYPVKGADHFTILAPVNKLLADKILHDDGPTLNIKLTVEELNSLIAK